jgi:hypothetical protein
MNVETILLTALTFDPNNARKHDNKNIEAIAGSLKQFGQRKPIVITENNIIVAGNGTVTAAKQLGWTDIKVVRVPKDWDENQVKAFALADNRTAELAEWDKDILASQIIDLQTDGWDTEQLGFWETPETELDATEKPLQEKYEVVIECQNEIEQQNLLERFYGEGLKVRAVVL